ncbi:MAG: hypothetical protein EOP88_08125 [Verrucomicrobiaceae bacterium]|nr:MAG: hypothetical protein EOP88_08125 [Verrucomicrobiaceae bacterium]
MLYLAEVQNTTTAFFSGLAGLVGVLGVVASIKAFLSIRRDDAEIRRAEYKLLSYESWIGAYQPEKQSLVNWFRERGIQQDSGVGDVISACWAAFQGKRSVSLTEIHVLVARRERTKWEVKLSGGIIGLLLVIGIVGTLFSVHPVLTEFKFNVSDREGEEKLVNVVDSTERVNSLMRDLGNAFLPSLFALCGTIVVVTARGFYSKALNRYTLDLDRFAILTVIPRFRPNSISEEYEIVRKSFDRLADNIGSRDEKFDKLLEGLSGFVTSTEKTLAGLEFSIKRMNDAAESLTNRTGSIGESLIKTLGQGSPLLGAVTGYEEVFRNANSQMTALSESVESFDKRNEEGGRLIADSARKFADILESMADAHEEDRKKLSTLLAYIVQERGEERAAFVAAAEKISSGQVDASQAIDGTMKELSELTAIMPAKMVEATRMTLGRELDAMKDSLNGFIASSSETIARNAGETGDTASSVPAKFQPLIPRQTGSPEAGESETENR